MAVMQLWFTLSLPAMGYHSGLLPHSMFGLTLAIIIIGLSQSSMSPIFYELCAELTYPVPEGTSAGILAFIWNAAALVMIFLSPVINSDYINTIVTITVFVCIGMVLSVKETYNRPQDALPDQGRPSASPNLNV